MHHFYPLQFLQSHIMYKRKNIIPSHLNMGFNPNTLPIGIGYRINGYACRYFYVSIYPPIYCIECSGEPARNRTNNWKVADPWKGFLQGCFANRLLGHWYCSRSSWPSMPYPPYICVGKSPYIEIANIPIEYANIFKAIIVLFLFL